jgi:hypothetical protein
MDENVKHKYHTGKHRALSDASKEVSLEENAENVKYMVVSRYRNTGTMINNMKMWHSSNI